MLAAKAAYQPLLDVLELATTMCNHITDTQFQKLIAIDVPNSWFTAKIDRIGPTTNSATISAKIPPTPNVTNALFNI